MPPVLACLCSRPGAGEAADDKAPAAAAALAAHKLVGRVDGEQATPRAVEGSARVALALVLRYAERLQSGLAEPDCRLLAAV